MSAIALAAAADPTIEWALRVAEAAELAKEADQVAAAAHQHLDGVLAAKPPQ